MTTIRARVKRSTTIGLTSRERLWNLLKAAIAIGLAAYVFTRVNIEDLIRAWQQISPAWLLAEILIFGLMVWAMARRYWVLIAKQTTFRQLLGLVVVQTAIGNLVATSAGAASYVLLLRGRHQVNLTQGIGSIILARIYDLVVLIVALALSGWMVWEKVVGLRWLIASLLAIMLCVTLLLPVAYVIRRPLVGASRGLAERSKLDRFAFVTRFIRSLESFAEQDMAEARASAVEVGLFSVLILGLNIALAYCSVQLFAIPIGIWPIIFMLALTQIVGLIPIQVSGGLGVFDVTLLYLYGLFGFAQAQIAPAIIGWRVISYAINLLLLSYLPIESRLTPRPGQTLSPQ